MLEIEMVDGVPEIHPNNLRKHLGTIRLVDVRQPDEYVGELGHIAGAELVTLGPELQALLDTGKRDETIVFVCRSGGRSGRATMVSRAMGYANTVNMTGGMLLWNQLGLPTTKEAAK